MIKHQPLTRQADQIPRLSGIRTKKGATSVDVTPLPGPLFEIRSFSNSGWRLGPSPLPRPFAAARTRAPSPSFEKKYRSSLRKNPSDSLSFSACSSCSWSPPGCVVRVHYGTSPTVLRIQNQVLSFRCSWCLRMVRVIASGDRPTSSSSIFRGPCST
jgi:hypothetical protein